MPLAAIPDYLWECYRRETEQEELRKFAIKRDAFVADCLWALATDSRWRDKNNKPTLPRFFEFLEDKKQEEKGPITKALYIQHLKEKQKALKK